MLINDTVVDTKQYAVQIWKEALTKYKIAKPFLLTNVTKNYHCYSNQSLLCS